MSCIAGPHHGSGRESRPQQYYMAVLVATVDSVFLGNTWFGVMLLVWVRCEHVSAALLLLVAVVLFISARGGVHSEWCNAACEYQTGGWPGDWQEFVLHLLAWQPPRHTELRWELRRVLPAVGYDEKGWNQGASAEELAAAPQEHVCSTAALMALCLHWVDCRRQHVH
eukprot:5042042-Amphidinium_carterae.2